MLVSPLIKVYVPAPVAPRSLRLKTVGAVTAAVDDSRSKSLFTPAVVPPLLKVKFMLPPARIKLRRVNVETVALVPMKISLPLLAVTWAEND